MFLFVSVAFGSGHPNLPTSEQTFQSLKLRRSEEQVCSAVPRAFFGSCIVFDSTSYEQRKGPHQSSLRVEHQRLGTVVLCHSLFIQWGCVVDMSWYPHQVRHTLGLSVAAAVAQAEVCARSNCRRACQGQECRLVTSVGCAVVGDHMLRSYYD